MAATLVWASGWFRAQPIPLGALRTPFVLPEGTAPWSDIFQPDFVPSPDGKSIVFAAISNGVQYLWVQALDSLTAQRLDQTEGANSPFWSPDGKFIAFFSNDQLKRVSVSGGASSSICRAPDVQGGGSTIQGGSWGPDGSIIFSGRGGLQRVMAGGGAPTQLTHADTARGESAHVYPQFLPDGKHFLYLAGPGNEGIDVQELGSNQRTPVMKTRARALYASGYLLFVRDDALNAQPFDLRHLRLRGEAALVAPHLSVASANPNCALGASENGVLAYRNDEVPGAMERLTWYDRGGHVLGTVGDRADYSNPALSPDGSWLAVGIGRTNVDRDIWLLDLLRGAQQRLTTDPADDYNPTWSPNGRRIAFGSNRRNKRDMYIKNAFGTEPEQMILDAGSSGQTSPEDWSPDGRWIAYNTSSKGIHMLSPESGKTQAFTSGTEHGARFSPDGKWIAYQSRESGRWEVYVQPFPPTGERAQISTGGGLEPKWRGDGKELYYGIQGDSPAIFAVDIAVKDGAIQPGTPHKLFSIPVEESSRRDDWLVTPDGKRFLVMVPGPPKPPAIRLVVVHNWPALLENARNPRPPLW